MGKKQVRTKQNELQGDYNIIPQARVVNKLIKYPIQYEKSEKLKDTASSLINLANGIDNVNYRASKSVNESTIEDIAKNQEKNKRDWAEVSKNFDDMAKFNPYNLEEYKTLRAKELMQESLAQLQDLEPICESLSPDEFEARQNDIFNELTGNMSSEGLQANHIGDYLIKFQNAQKEMRKLYVNNNAKYNYGLLQDELIKTLSYDMADLTRVNQKGYIEGWTEAVKNFEKSANNVGMDNFKQKELFNRSINKYLAENVNNIDLEEFISALNQTKLNGHSLNEFESNFINSKKREFILAKRAKYQEDTINLQAQKQACENEVLNVNAQIFNLMSNSTVSDDEIIEKIDELQEELSEKGMNNELFNGSDLTDNLTILRKTPTNEKVNNTLRKEYLNGNLKQNEVISAFLDKQLNINDALSYTKALQNGGIEEFREDIKDLTGLYSNNNPYFDIKDEDKTDVTKAIYEVISDNELSKQDKREAFLRIKKAVVCMKNEEAEHKHAQKSDYETAENETNSLKDYGEAQKYLTILGINGNNNYYKA